ncbi:YybH family protein [Aspergillus niger CBS 101883]|uniref:SnoaL-like domain-containing protein n=2 Tax=Aspergillus TaxID=5052 RepID=A0A370PJ71_ASPPH|nr:uncharacterized protein BO96DRAFT_501137 [Aspergillus niger CBS 101883]PYH55560.1 hypothetical protein BO96DRAFT_501137 [Aspergillus niger CBS 101883]RDH16571.1 hypothetical protein M747DRAFT_345254 [Aspergillus niger ATCC 13496]RDK42235.1 hypothetical protein M752DRAFT_293355 [Aspergillus phoenicis ATCC 13157]
MRIFNETQGTCNLIDWRHQTVIRKNSAFKPFPDTPGIGNSSVVPSTDTEEISTLLHAYGEALKSRNVDEAVALYTEDGVIMPPHFSASTGTEALRDSYTRIFATIQLVINFQIEEIVIMSPEWAFARTTAEGTKTILATQESESHANQELFILRRNNGKWLIARYAFSSMKPFVQNGIRRS